MSDHVLELNDPVKQKRLNDAVDYSMYASGKTHNFYRYPARFSPEFARVVISEFSKPDDWVLDPFMGGGTSIIEGLTLGRLMLGVDLNALAHFVATVRTTPLSDNDEEKFLAWAEWAPSILLSLPKVECARSSDIRNLPSSVQTFIGGALKLADEFPLPRQRAFARCALLRLGQWALDCRDFSPRRRCLARYFPDLVRSMLGGLNEFVNHCRLSGVSKNQITGRRVLLNRNAISLHQENSLHPLKGRVKLVLTSPPYPGVHVLYHRWQYRGRRETPAPYWIASIPDGAGASFYTFGSRTPTGMERYFKTLREAFISVRPLLARDALIVQLVAFSDAKSQLPLFLQSMESAGYKEVHLPAGVARLTRRVPNRKWYAKLREDIDAAREILLIHKPG